jgi:hypothetical protein
MLDPKHESQYQKVMGVERSLYWKGVAMKLNEENIQLKLKLMDLHKSFKIYTMWIGAGVALLLVAIMMRCG